MAIEDSERTDKTFGLVLSVTASLAFSPYVLRYDLALLPIPIVLGVAWYGRGSDLRRSISLMPFAFFYLEFAFREVSLGGLIFNISSLLFLILLGALICAPQLFPGPRLGVQVRREEGSWTALTRFREDGCLGLDNNEVERQLRDIPLGRKNFLFAGSHAAAKRTARRSAMKTTVESTVSMPKGLSISFSLCPPLPSIFSSYTILGTRSGGDRCSPDE